MVVGELVPSHRREEFPESEHLGAKFPKLDILLLCGHQNL